MADTLYQRSANTTHHTRATTAPTHHTCIRASKPRFPADRTLKDDPWAPPHTCFNRQNTQFHTLALTHIHQMLRKRHDAPQPSRLQRMDQPYSPIPVSPAAGAFVCCALPVNTTNGCWVFSPTLPITHAAERTRCFPTPPTRPTFCHTCRRGRCPVRPP